MKKHRTTIIVIIVLVIIIILYIYSKSSQITNPIGSDSTLAVLPTSNANTPLTNDPIMTMGVSATPAASAPTATTLPGQKLVNINGAMVYVPNDVTI